MGEVQAALAHKGRELIKLTDNALHRVLQLRLVVDFHDDLPRRRRQHRPVEGERKFAAERRSKVAANIHTLRSLQIIHLLLNIRLDRLDELEQIVDQLCRLIHDKRGHDIGVRGDEIERSHRSRCRKPRRDPAVCLCEGQRGLAQSAAVRFLLLRDKVSQVHDAKLLEAINVTLIFRAAGLARHLGDDPFEIGRDDQTRAIFVHIIDPLMER